MVSSDRKFQSEVIELCTEIMNQGVLPALLVLGWGGALFAQFNAGVINIEGALGYLAIFGLGCSCLLLNHFHLNHISLWISSWGSLVLTLIILYVSRDASIIQWITIACTVVIFFSGAPAGWASVVAAAGVITFLAIRQPSVNLNSTNLVQLLLPLFTLALFATIVARVLYRTLAWMSQGYEQARENSEQASRQSAELSLALKSLNQTSFALARVNEQLRAMVTVAEDARRSKQEFAASISHELRMPLNLIIGFSDVILSAPSTYNIRRLPPKLLADIHVIQRNAQHLMQMVNDVLDLSQMDVSHMTIVREPLKLDEFIQSSLGEFAQLVESRNLRLEVDIEHDLPEIHADRTRVQQVLLNLLNNALRFTEQGSITIRVRRQASSTPEQWSGENIIFSVSDTGIGIPPDNLKRIFEPFIQADSSRQRKRGGTGLGLTISKRFVELHGGQMWAESTVGVGSSFYFTLPVQLPAEMISAEYTSQKVQRREVGHLCIVEPRPLIYRLLERRIQGIGLTHAQSIEEMLAQAKVEPPEAVLINQPFESMAQPQWQDELKHMPVLSCFIPGDFHSTHASASKPSVTRCFLVKPVLREQLYEALTDMLSTYSPREQAAEPNSENNRGLTSRSARILLIEEDDDTLQLIDRMLRAAPRTVLQNYSDIIPLKVHTVEEALALLRASGTPPLQGIILDLADDAPHGLEMLQAMEQHEYLRNTPICIISGQEPTGASMTSPYLTLTRQDGLTVQELIQSTTALMQIALPGIELRVQ
jgi:signal transduction histidine kinase/CheY-like chemotaxis protein